MVVACLAEKRDQEIEKEEASLSKAKLLFECVTERKHVRVFEGSKSKPIYEEVGPPVVMIEGGESRVEGTGVCRHSVWEFVRGGDRITVETLGCTDGREPAGTIGFLRTVSAEDESHEFCKTLSGE